MTNSSSDPGPSSLGHNRTTWPSPAKLNLMLHITGKNSQGYHNLQTVFQLLDYGDELTIEPNTTGAIEFSCSLPELAGNNNLVVQAANTLQQATHCQQGAKIHLEKKLPIGGGVGGGSSNCATTLVALNQMWQCGLTTEQLCAMSVALGADVPVFVAGNSAWAEGIGEQLTPIELESLWYLVLHPGCFVSTQKIFSSSALTRDCEISKIRDFLAQGGPKHGNNVMEPVVFDLYPDVKKARDWLLQYNSAARMTGSGSCVFAPFDNEREARKIAALCETPHFVARGVNRSTLYLDSP